MSKDDPAGLVRPGDQLLHVSCGGGAAMSIPRINNDGSLGWRLIWNEPCKANNMAAASALESYNYIVDHCNKEEAWRRIKLLRAARQEHAL